MAGGRGPSLIWRTRVWATLTAVGGLTERLFGPLAPFQTAFCMLVFCTIFGALCLPYIAPTKTAASSDGKKASGAASFLAPLALFIPRRITYEDGSRGPRQWSLLFLALGAFFSVFATAFVPLGLQLVSTNVFGFRPAETGLMLVSPWSRVHVTGPLRRGFWRCGTDGSLLPCSSRRSSCRSASRPS